MTDVPLRCRCAHVRGVARDVSPSAGNHVVCYCDDCQAFARFLGTPGILDANGGTDIYQLAPARVTIDEGQDALACVRLSPKGLLRWYAGCCKTPIANTVSARVPFVGLVQPIMDHDAAGLRREDALGPVLARAFARFAAGEPPGGAHAKVPLWLYFRFARTIGAWWLFARGPSPFFDATTGAPRAAPRVLTPEERRALATR
jgi:hypothetical protein